MGHSHQSFDSLGCASDRQDDQVNPPHSQDRKVQQAPASQPYGSAEQGVREHNRKDDLSTGRQQKLQKNTQHKAVNNKPYAKKDSSENSLVNETGQEDPGSQVDQG